MRRLLDASGESLTGFVQDAVEPGSLVHTDGWPGYEPLRRNGYRHRITYLQGQAPSELLPHVHRVVSLRKRWLLGTHHGAATHEHVDYYLDEFTFRFNHRRSRSRGMHVTSGWPQQAVAVDRRPTNRLSSTPDFGRDRGPQYPGVTGVR